MNPFATAVKIQAKELINNEIRFSYSESFDLSRYIRLSLFFIIQGVRLVSRRESVRLPA